MGETAGVSADTDDAPVITNGRHRRRRVTVACRVGRVDCEPIRLVIGARPAHGSLGLGGGAGRVAVGRLRPQELRHHRPNSHERQRREGSRPLDWARRQGPGAVRHFGAEGPHRGAPDLALRRFGPGGAARSPDIGSPRPAESHRDRSDCGRLVPVNTEGLRFALLGPLEVTRDRRAVRLGGPKPRLALALLALEVGRVVSVDALVEALWGDHPPAKALGTLQVNMSALRRALEVPGTAPCLVNRPPGYVLDVAPETVDTVEFGEMLDRGAPSLQRVVTSKQAVCCAAEGLWRGAAAADLAASTRSPRPRSHSTTHALRHSSCDWQPISARRACGSGTGAAGRGRRPCIRCEKTCARC